MAEPSADHFNRDLLELLPRLRRYALALSRSTQTAEDLAQATCVRAIEYKSHFVRGTHFDRWVFSILVSLWRNEVRARRVRLGNGCVEADSVACTDMERALDRRIMGRQIRDAVDDLPEAQRRAVVHVYLEGRSYKEAAELENIPIGTIMSRLSAARNKLVARFNAGDGAEPSFE